MSFRFIHCADLHLDTPFIGITADNPEISGTIRESTFEAFSSVVRLSIETGAEFLLLAGDIFDNGRQTVRAVMRFRDMLQELSDSGIRTFMVHGNHDPAGTAFSAISWPESVHIFPGSGPQCVNFSAKDGSSISVTGQSHETASVKKNLAAEFPRRPDTEFRIALLHALAGKGSVHAPYAPCTVSQLKQHGFDYWALGHVHNFKILATHPHVVYPGCIQGRSFRETGPRGCVCVNVQDGEVMDTEFHPVDSVRWEQADIPINGFNTVDALEQAILDKIESLSVDTEGRPLICRLALTGRGALYRTLYRDSTRDELVERLREGLSGTNPFIWLQAIKTFCLPEFDMKERMKGDDFLSRVLLTGEELAEQDIAGSVLAELLSDRRVSRLDISWDRDDFRDIITRAQLLCADLLEGETEA